MSKAVQLRKSEFKLVKWDKLKTYDFNSLKEASARDVSKLKNAIVNSQFSFPFYVWKRFVIDGAGRRKALEELEREGYTIDELPVIEIEAANQRDAQKLVLQSSSTHGEVTKNSFDLFVEDLDLSELELEEINLPLELDSMDEYNNLHTDDQDLIDPERDKKQIDNDYVVILQLSPPLAKILQKEKNKASVILSILERELLND